MCRMSVMWLTFHINNEYSLSSAQWYFISLTSGPLNQMGRNRLKPLSVEAELCSTLWETETLVFHKPHKQGYRNCLREDIRKVHRRMDLTDGDLARRNMLLDPQEDGVQVLDFA